MRNNLVSALLVILVTVGLSVSVSFFAEHNSTLAAKSLITNVPSSSGVKSNFHRSRVSMPADELNVLIARKMLPRGTKSLLKVAAPMQHGDYVWDEEGVGAGKVKIWVDLRRQLISAFRNGHEIGTAVIVYGAESQSSPEGIFPVIKKMRHYHSRTYDAPMPASLFITNDGVALHGSPMSKRRASHGCIGLPVEFAYKLFDATNVGDLVEITRSDATFGR